MNNTPTPHNAAKCGEIAPTVLMPGDPLRAEFIAETYLTDVRRVSAVRNMYAFTGTYNGRDVSVMGAGMGMPSMGIYSYELYHFYGVEQIIRVGSAGALQDDIGLNDIILAMSASTDSNYASQYHLPGTLAPTADFSLLSRTAANAKARSLRVHVGNVLSSDFFYNAADTVNDSWRRMGVLAAEMECAALYMNAAYSGKKALGILTVSDHLYRKESLSAEKRQNGFGTMIELALSLI